MIVLWFLALALALFCYVVGRCHEGCREGGTLDLRAARDHDAETIALLARECDRLRSAVLRVPGPRTLDERDATVLSFRRTLPSERAR